MSNAYTPPLAAEPSLNRMYRLAELPLFVGLKRTQIGEMMKTGQFPRPVPLNNSGRAVAWLESDLIAWQNSRIVARNSGDCQRASPATGRVRV